MLNRTLQSGAFSEACRSFRLLLLALVGGWIAVMPVAAQTVEIVGFGDSLMAGYQLPEEDGFTAQLQRRLLADGLDVSVINAGVSGDTSSGGLDRLDWSVPDTAQIVILELGANDALRGISPDITRANLEAMILRLKERGKVVLLAGMLAPPNMGEAYGVAFNTIYPELAAKHDVALHPFFLDGVAGQPQLQLDDGMHPNAEGVARMVDGIAPLVRTLAEQVASASGN